MRTDTTVRKGIFPFKKRYKKIPPTVSGRLQIRNWTDKEGNKRRSAEVVADNVYFGESKRGNEGASSYSNSYSNGGSYNNNPAPAPSYGGGYSAPAAAPASDFAMLEDDDAQLPF